MKTDFLLVNKIEPLASLSDRSVVEGFDFSPADGVSENFIYNEMSDFPVRSRSELESLKENVMVLRDLSARLTFLSKEINYLLNIK